MPDRSVTQLRPRASSGYTDTAALNDIHTLLTTTDPGDGALADITQILTRTGRSATSRSPPPRPRAAGRSPAPRPVTPRW